MMRFNEQQLKAINHKDGACAVIAGAGSGKSTVMIERIKTLIENGIKPEDILAISFTRNTAKDLKRKLKDKDIEGVNIGTFHAICYRILLSEGVDIGKSLREYEITNTLSRSNGREKVDTRDILSFISYQKNYGKTYTDEFVYKESNYSETDLRKFFKVYEDLKKRKKAYDLDDTLLECLKVLQEHPNKHTFKYVLVDEHQDSNLVQNMLIKALCPSNNVFCVFDYRQAIYTFRGGNPEYCMNFSKEFPNATIINLDINYRSTNNIVENANRYIKQYYGDYKYYSDGIANNKENGNIQIISNEGKSDECKKMVDVIEKKLEQGADLNDFAILYRLNSSVDYMENELKSRGIEYYIDNDGSFFKRKEIVGVMCILRLIQNVHDDEAFETVFKMRTNPLGFLKNDLLNNIKDFAAIHNLSLYEAGQLMDMGYREKKNFKRFDEYIHSLQLQYQKTIDLKKLVDNIIESFSIKDWVERISKTLEEQEEREEGLNSLKEFIRSNTLDSFITYVYSSNKEKKECKDNCVKLMSVHKSKGLEFKTVFIIGVTDGKFPHKKSDILDEARLFYVAITRAKENLYISQIYEGNLFVEQYKKDMIQIKKIA